MRVLPSPFLLQATVSAADVRDRAVGVILRARVLDGAGSAVIFSIICCMHNPALRTHPVGT